MDLISMNKIDETGRTQISMKQECELTMALQCGIFFESIHVSVKKELSLSLLVMNGSRGHVSVQTTTNEGYIIRKEHSHPVMVSFAFLCTPTNLLPKHGILDLSEEKWIDDTISLDYRNKRVEGGVHWGRISSVYTAVHGSTWMYIRLNRFTSVYTGVHPVKSSCTLWWIEQRKVSKLRMKMKDDKREIQQAITVQSSMDGLLRDASISYNTGLLACEKPGTPLETDTLYNCRRSSKL
ncbi:hypothetical protein ARMGADRAFT_1035946 [Armillaria gallica]|uniref:Uncharacterized protein n=1 Tax=Armillaria gallica TaxID=47427 RepID=A0A2H3CSE7_ARMGA|nr:hypothetical protein ARMGADRAFT_1035946 [Armillaria gallica]